MVQYLEREVAELKDKNLGLEREVDEMSRVLVETQTRTQEGLEEARDALNKEQQTSRSRRQA
jgi:FtsZ-binding cell division protein ZapB